MKIVWTIVIFLAIVGLVTVIRRMLMLSGIIPVTQTFDEGITKQPALIVTHIIAGALFMLLGPLQFVKRIREKHLRFHRISGRIFIFCCYVIGITAFILAFTTPIGKENETAVASLFAVLFLFTITKALNHILKKEVSLHREWMIRAFAIGLAISTIRPIVGMFFAFSHLSPKEFFGIAFWLGFTLHLLIAEVWINYTRGQNKAKAANH